MISMLAKLGIFAFVIFNSSNTILRQRQSVLPTPKDSNSGNTRILATVRNCRSPRKLQTYVEENVLTAFTLYTIVNECCRAIIIYHNKFTEYHGNTTLANFKLKNDLQCIYLDNSTDILTGTNKLDNTTKYADYDTFFASYGDALMKKNKHFSNIFELYKTSFYKSIS